MKLEFYLPPGFADWRTSLLIVGVLGVLVPGAMLALAIHRERLYRHRLRSGSWPDVARNADCARFYRVWVLTLWACIGFIHTVALGRADLLWLFGETTSIRVLDVRLHKTRVRSREHGETYFLDSFVAEVASMGCRTRRCSLQVETSLGVYLAFRAGTLQHVPFRVVPWLPRVRQIGPRVMLGAGEVVATFSITTLAMVGLGISRWMARRRFRSRNGSSDA